MWRLDHKKGWAPKNWCFWTVVLEKTLESPLDCKEIKPLNPKGNQSWIFIGRIGAEAEAPIPWLPDAKIWLIGKDPNPGKDRRQEEKGPAEEEMVGWHHRLNGHEFNKFREMVKDRKTYVLQSVGLQTPGRDWAAEQQRSALHSVSALSFLLSFYYEPLWNLHEASFTLNTLLNTSIRNAFSMLIRNAFCMLQRNTVFPVILRTWTLMCHSKNFIYQQTWTGSTKVYRQGCAFGINIWKQIKCPQAENWWN